MNDLRLYELLKKQQRNDLTDEEEHLLNEWFNNQDYSGSRDLPVKPVKVRVWSAIEARLHLKQKRQGYAIRYAAAAAVLAVIVCSGLLFMGKHSEPALEMKPAMVLKTIQVPHGKQVRLALSDGSTVWLSGGAILEYPGSFDTIRNVSLQEGEAFFEVAKDAARPFIVHSRNLHTQVLGTSFIIRNQNGHYSVAVASGKVKVYNSNKSGKANISQTLEAGERLATDSLAKHLVMDRSDQGLYKGWISKTYQLKDVSLSSVVFCMESVYGVNIHIRNKDFRGLRFTTNVSSRDKMEDVLSRLSLAGGFHYRKESQGSVIIY